MLNADQAKLKYGIDSDSLFGSERIQFKPQLHAVESDSSGTSAPAAKVARRSKLDVMAKRAFDIVFALGFLIAALPFLVLISIGVMIDSRGPLFFAQNRIGQHGRIFRCYKFRTMRVDAEAALAEILANCPEARREWEADHKLRIDPRVSRLGRLMRKLSFDELPQLINILRGDMSVVGPRPIVQDEVRKYGRFFADYCAVKPGLTGLWQVSGRNDVSYAMRVRLDREYRLRGSFAYDLRIILKTVPAVVAARGSY